MALYIFEGLATLAVLVAALEIVARMWARSLDYYVWRRWSRFRMELKNGALPSLEPVVRFEVNAEGERGDPLPREREGLYRVLVAGGSAAECGLLDQPSAWPAVLQASLNRSENLELLGARAVHVGNVGRSLTAAGAVCRILERILPRYEKLDLLILMVGASDALEWLENKTPAEWPKTTEQVVEFGECPDNKFSVRGRKPAIRFLLGTLWRRYGKAVQTRKDFGVRMSELRERRRQASELIGTLPDPGPMLDNLARHVRRAVELGKKKGARVVLVRQPWFDRELTPEENAVMWNFCRAQSSSGEMSSAYYSHGAVRGLLSRVDHVLAEVAHQMGVESVNLRTQIVPGLTNFYDFLHFTPVGARRVATAVADAVLHNSATGDSLHRLAAAAGVPANHIAEGRTAIMVASAQSE